MSLAYRTMLEITGGETGLASVSAFAAVIFAAEGRPWPRGARRFALLLAITLTAEVVQSATLLAWTPAVGLLVEPMGLTTATIGVATCALALEDWLYQRRVTADATGLTPALIFVVCLNGATVYWWLRGPVAVGVGVATGAMLGVLAALRVLRRGWSRRRAGLTGVVTMAALAALLASRAAAETETQMSMLAAVGLGARAALSTLWPPLRGTRFGRCVAPAPAPGRSDALDPAWRPWIALIWIGVPILLGVNLGERGSLIGSLAILAGLVPAVWVRAHSCPAPDAERPRPNRVRVIPLPGRPGLRLPPNLARYRDLKGRNLYAHRVPAGILLNHDPEESFDSDKST